MYKDSPVFKEPPKNIYLAGGKKYSKVEYFERKENFKIIGLLKVFQVLRYFKKYSGGIFF